MPQEMTVNEAVRIIGESFEFGEKFDAAVQFLKDNDPNNAVLAPISDKDMAEVKKARAKAYLGKALAEEEFGGQFNEAVALLKKDKEAQEAVAEGQKIFDKENHLDMEDEEAVLRNAGKIGKMLDGIDYQSVTEKDEFSDMAELMGKVEIHDRDENGQDNGPVDDDKKVDYWNAAIETAKMQAMMLRAGDLGFFMKKDEEKKETLNRDVKNFFTIGVAQGVAADAMQTPRDKEVVAGSKEYEAYVQSESKKAENAINNLFAGKKKAVLTTDSILVNAVEVSNKMDAYTARWGQKGFKRVADFFKGTKEKFVGVLKAVWGNRAEIKKNVVEHAKNNKWRLIADTAATGIVAVAAGTGLALPAVAGYALYTAAGSWTWPLIEKKTKEIRAAKKAGASTKEWDGIAGIKKAYADIKSNKDEYRKYKNRAYTGTAFGIAGAGLVAGMGAASGWVVDKAGYLTARATSTFVRSVGSVTSQFMNYRDSKNDFKADASAENRAKLQQAKAGLGIGMAIAVVGNWLGFNHVVDSEQANEAVSQAGAPSQGFMDRMRALFGGNDDGVDATTGAAVTAGMTSDTQDVVGNTGGAAALVEDTGVEVSVPDAYNADMKISAAHWNEMHRKLTGIYENQAAIFGKTNVPSAEAWENMYTNLENARAANPDLFGKDTNEQVLYKYMKLIESTERVKNGPEGYLVTRLAADGLPTYGNKEMTETMRALNDVIICGKEVKVPAEKMNGVLAYVDEQKGAYVGPGADVGVTNNAYIGGRADCGDYQNAWKKAVRRVAARIKPEEEVAPVAEVPQAEPEEHIVDEVVENKAPARQEAVVDEVVVNEPATGPKYDIYEGATDGNLDVNDSKVARRAKKIASIAVPSGNEGR